MSRSDQVAHAGCSFCVRLSAVTVVVSLLAAECEGQMEQSGFDFGLRLVRQCGCWRLLARCLRLRLDLPDHSFFPGEWHALEWALPAGLLGTARAPRRCCYISAGQYQMQQLWYHTRHWADCASATLIGGVCAQGLGMLGLTPLILILRRADREKQEKATRIAALASGGETCLEVSGTPEAAPSPRRASQAVGTQRLASLRSQELEDIAEGAAVATGA